MITANSSAAHTAAALLLKILEVEEPPITPEMVMGRLGLNLRTLPHFDLDRLTPTERAKFGSVRALFSPAEKRIYLPHDLSIHQKQGAILHETGHFFIEWHQKALFLDDKFTLSPKVRDIMEIEANEFAAYVRFMGDKFTLEAKELTFGIHSMLALKDRYAASIEGSIRRYVETSDRDCICQIFNIESGGLKLHYFIRPTKIASQWRTDCAVRAFLPEEHLIVQTFEENVTVGHTHEEFISSESGLICRQMFCDGHRLFVFEFEIM